MQPPTLRPRNAKRALAQYEAARGTKNARGYGRRHEKFRRQVLARDPICTASIDGRRCHATATIAHHDPIERSVSDLPYETAFPQVTRALTGPALHDFLGAASWRDWIRYSLFNGSGLCAGCHNRTHKGRDDNG